MKNYICKKEFRIKMATIPFISAFLYFFLGLLIFTKKNKIKSDFILSIYFFISALILFLAGAEIYNRQSGYPFPWIINASTPFILLIGPVLWLYIKALTTQNFQVKPIYLLNLIPFVLVFSLFAISIYFLPADEKIKYDTTESFRTGIVYPLVVILIAISNVGYTLWGMLLLSRYRHRIRFFYSQTDTLDLKWLQSLLVMALFFYAIISILYIADYLFGLMKYGLLQGLGFAFISIFSVLLGYYGLRQGNLFNPYINVDFDILSTNQTDCYSKPIPDKDEAFVIRLLEYMKIHKPYLNPEINLAMLSEQLMVSPEYLSEMINSRLNKNFFDFINHYRIEEFKELCKNAKNKNFTLLSLAFDCGFNSKATFNRVFKKNTGITPSEYFKKVSIN